jgi:hypothetical protein
MGGAATFDGQGVADRLTRRQRNWIADAEFDPCGDSVAAITLAP